MVSTVVPSSPLDPRGCIKKRQRGKLAVSGTPEILVIDEDDTIAPQNEMESALLSEIQTKIPWYQNKKREILEQIRNTKGTLTADAVIAEVNKQEQELEETRQLDQARLLSEQENEKEAAKRRKLQDEKVDNASLEQWKTTFFNSSFILQSQEMVQLLQPFVTDDTPDKDTTAVVIPTAIIITITQQRKQLLRLLRLERKALKWYPTQSRAHFLHHVCPAIAAAAGEAMNNNSNKTPDPNVLLSCLSREAERVEKAMYALCEQAGPVPRLFLQALETWPENNGNGDIKDDDDDNEVVVVIRNKSSRTNKTAGEQQVLEIA